MKFTYFFKSFHDFALSLEPGSTIDVLPCPWLCHAVETSHLGRSLVCSLGFVNILMLEFSFDMNFLMSTT